MALYPVSESQYNDVALGINETPQRLEENMFLLKQWLSCQPHLPKQMHDDRLLASFLRGCKHHLDRTKKKLDRFIASKTIYPSLFTGRNPFSASFKKAIENFHIVPLPILNSDGCRITMFRFMKEDGSDFDSIAVFQAIFMVADIRLIEEDILGGDVFMFDVQNITFSHAKRICNPALKHALESAQEAFPHRLKEIHLFNAPAVIDRVNSFIKPFLKEKIRNRYHTHTGHETLYNFVTKSHLPKDYGGDLPPLSQLQASWVKKIESYTEYFNHQDTLKSDESLRPQKSEFDGNEGTFRRLQID